MSCRLLFEAQQIGRQLSAMQRNQLLLGQIAKFPVAIR